MDRADLADKIDMILPRVSQPATYIGGEVNSVVKAAATVCVRFLLAFPDLYEVGMSHLGSKILYEAVNHEPDMACERSFAPNIDMEEEMRKEGVPLYSLETWSAASEFDVIGFSLQHELCYTNLLNMLDLAGIPLYACDRRRDHPLVIAGGPCAYNPEPLSPFLDAVILGDGEESLVSFLRQVRESKSGDGTRGQLLKELAEVAGVYVPSLYHFTYQGLSVEAMKVEEPAKSTVVASRVKDLDEACFPTAFVIPHTETVHDRVSIELFRGCTRGCRFCQAGMVYRPVRERSPGALVDQVKRLLKSTGYDEVSLMSLSSADYSEIKGLIRALEAQCGSPNLRVSLPSLRVDSFSADLAALTSGVRKSSITLAPEAASQRLRNVINKNVTEEDILCAVRTAFRSGFNTVKLYFMIGLPTETDEDVSAIGALAEKILGIGRDEAKGRGASPSRIQVNVSVSSFIPKPHTPFQWVAMDSRETMRRKVEVLKKSIRSRPVRLSWRDSETTLLEAAMARGDRRLAPVVEAAYRAGCRMDGWSERFDADSWRRAFSESGLDLQDYATAPRPIELTLPYDHLSSGVSKGYLLAELDRAMAGETTPDCRIDPCTECGVCSTLDVRPRLSTDYEGGGSTHV